MDGAHLDPPQFCVSPRVRAPGPASPLREALGVKSKDSKPPAEPQVEIRAGARLPRQVKKAGKVSHPVTRWCI